MKKCDIIIPVWDELESTRKCINALKNNSLDYPYTLIVIDNGSQKPTKDYLEGLKKDFSDYVLIRNNDNLGFVKAVNQGMRVSNNPYICLLNNDAYVTENWLTSLIETLESGPANIGIVNPTSNVFGKTSYDGKEHEWQELDYCRGFSMLIKREVIEKIGFFDEIYGIGYFEEKDFCRMAIEAGFICIRAKSSFVFHRDRLSFDKLKERNDIFKKNEEIYNKRWGKPLNIAFVITENSTLEKKKAFIYKLLDRGHRIHIFFSKAKPIANLKDHIQIKYFPISNPFFCYWVLFKLWERRYKKKIEFIFVNDEDMLKFFNRFKSIHNATVSQEEAI